MHVQDISIVVTPLGRPGRKSVSISIVTPEWETKVRATFTSLAIVALTFALTLGPGHLASAAPTGTAILAEGDSFGWD